ncbi:MAG: fumarylacetoacetate hydrolase family protein [Homoserinimonas sp.]
MTQSGTHEADSTAGGLLPVRPGKVIAVHLNYPSRAAERGRTPEQPGYFLKPATSLAPSGGTIERPAGCELLAFEGEIALVIGKETRRVTPAGGWASVSHVTASNDCGVYDLRYADKGSNLRSKGGDGFTPIGPALIAAADVDPATLRIRTWLNGELVQEDTTAELLFSFGRLVADLSQLITLEPGDIILTGTPTGASVMQPGDIVEVEVDGNGHSTGRLVTTVAEGTDALGEFGAQPKADDLQREEAWGAPRYGQLRQAQLVSTSSTSAKVLTPGLKDKINSVGTATLSSQLRKRGLNNVSIDGVSSTKPEARLVGIAQTLRFIPNREDLFTEHGGGYNAQKQAFDALGADDVLVVDARGERGTGTVGDILALRAQVNGAAGIVTDGGVRDVAAVTALDIPTYHSGAHPAVLGRRHVPWDTGLTIACGGTAVQPGDVIVGDADGVLVIPPHLIEELVDDSIEQERQETFIAEMVAAGEGVDGLYPMNADWKARYQQWLAR